MSEYRQTARPEGFPGGDVPPDWQAFGPDGEPPPPPRAGAPDLSPLFALLDALRAMVPRELHDQFTALVRELLLTLRTLIDWYLDRLDGDRREPRVEDIPID